MTCVAVALCAPRFSVASHVWHTLSLIAFGASSMMTCALRWRLHAPSPRAAAACLRDYTDGFAGASGAPSSPFDPIRDFVEGRLRAGSVFGRAARCFTQLMLAFALASTAPPPGTSGASSSSADPIRDFVEGRFGAAAPSDAPSAASRS